MVAIARISLKTSWMKFPELRGTDSWILLDLGSRMDIHSIEIAWYRGSSFDYYYEISVSNDGMEFKNVKIAATVVFQLLPNGIN